MLSYPAPALMISVRESLHAFIHSPDTFDPLQMMIFGLIDATFSGVRGDGAD